MAEKKIQPKAPAKVEKKTEKQAAARVSKVRRHHKVAIPGVGK